MPPTQSVFFSAVSPTSFFFPPQQSKRCHLQAQHAHDSPLDLPRSGWMSPPAPCRHPLCCVTFPAVQSCSCTPRLSMLGVHQVEEDLPFGQLLATPVCNLDGNPGEQQGKNTEGKVITICTGGREGAKGTQSRLGHPVFSGGPSFQPHGST